MLRIARWALASCVIALSVSARPVPGTSQVLYSTGFESGAAGWSFEGTTLWAADGTPKSVPGGAAYAGKKSLNFNNGKNFDTGASVDGTAWSPEIKNTPADHKYVLRFRCNYQTETTGSKYDKRIVWFAPNGDPDKGKSVQLNKGTAKCAGMGIWHLHEISYNRPFGMGEEDPSDFLQIGFQFDSVDEYGNDGAGWFVDDVQLLRAN